MPSYIRVAMVRVSLPGNTTLTKTVPNKPWEPYNLVAYSNLIVHVRSTREFTGSRCLKWDLAKEKPSKEKTRADDGKQLYLGILHMPIT